MRKQPEITIIHVFKDGTTSDTTEGRTVPAEIVERIAQIAAKCKRRATVERQTAAIQSNSGSPAA